MPISKDNPDIVIEWATHWMGKSATTDKLIKHACHTLLKQGDQKTLSLFGFAEVEHIELHQFEVQPKVALGQKLLFFIFT